MYFFHNKLKLQSNGPGFCRLSWSNHIPVNLFQPWLPHTLKFVWITAYFITATIRQILPGEEILGFSVVPLMHEEKSYHVPWGFFIHIGVSLLRLVRQISTVKTVRGLNIIKIDWEIGGEFWILYGSFAVKMFPHKKCIQVNTSSPFL